MKRTLLVSFAVGMFFGCDSGFNCENEPIQCFKEFPEFRMTVYLDGSLDPSYSDSEKWNFKNNSETSSSPGEIVPLLSVLATGSSFRITTSKGEYVGGSIGTFYIDYGNEDVDTVSYFHYALSYECCEASWFDSVTVNGDTLTRDSDLAFMFFKK